MSPPSSNNSDVWKKIQSLADSIISSDSLEEQCNKIKTLISDVFNSDATIWLDPQLFRLPSNNIGNQFTNLPPEVSRSPLTNNGSNIFFDRTTRRIDVFLRSQGINLGVLSIQHDGNKISRSEIERYEFLAAHLALALVASHRSAVEQWRVEQLTLVRRVSTQIARVNELHLLARKITRLILNAFKFYYVAIFTLKPGMKKLEFWSSAGPGKKSADRHSKQFPKVDLGQGLIGKGAIMGEEIITNDVSKDQRYREVKPLPGTKSEIVLPLKIGGKLLGVLDIQSEKIDAFHPNDLLVLRSLADNIAIAVSNNQLYADLEARADQLSIIAEVTRDITSLLDIEELLTKVATLIHKRLKFPHVYVFSVHNHRRQIIFEAGSGSRLNSLRGYSIDMDSPTGMIPWVSRTGETLLANNVKVESRYSPSPFPPANTRSELAIPLLYDKKPIGILDLQSNRINAFDMEDKKILEALADTIASAMHNAELYRTERWRRQVADSLSDVAGLISAEMGVDDVLDSVLRELERNLPCEIAAVWLVVGDDLSLAHIHGFNPHETEEARHSWPESDRFLHEVLISPEPIIRKPADPFDPIGIACGYSADYSSISVALRVGENPLGILTLAHHTAGRYGHEARAVISTFGNYSAIAIENARLYDSAQEQAYASAALLQVAQTVSHSSSLHDTINSVIRVTPILVGIKACAIYLWENEQFQPWGGYGFPDDVNNLLCKKGFVPGEFSLLDATFSQQKIIIGVLTQDLAEDWLDPELAKDDLESNYAIKTSANLLIGIPLTIRKDTYGVLLIHEAADERKFRQKRVEILTGIAQQISMSIQNDHLQREMVVRERFEHEIQLAKQIQQAFLPEHLPDISGWELGAKWRPAREVGGDFYDVFDLPGRKIGLLIADVSDKGIPAALFMALTRTVIRATVLNTDSPAKVIQRVNEIIVRDNREGMFITAIYGVLSLDSGSMIYSNAGHNPPIVISAKSEVCGLLNRTGPAIGVIPEFVIQEREIKLAKGDSLLMYTDGLTEAFSPEGLFFGLENVEKLIRSSEYTSPQELLDSLEMSLDTFTGFTPLADDLTMMVIHRKIGG